MNRLTSTITCLFPLWAVLFSVLAYCHPQTFVPLKPAVIPMLSVVMLGMGLTLTWNDFLVVVQNPSRILFGVCLQFALMPLFAFAISKGLRLPLYALVGMVLVGSSPGGTASNVICYLAGANVALSITLTMTSTLLSVVATPLLTWLYLNQSVPVPVGKMLMSVLQIVLIPVMVGTTFNTLLGKVIRRIKPIFPLVSVSAIVMIIAVIVAVNRPHIRQTGGLMLLGVMLHNGLGLSAGYWLARLFRFDHETARTLSIEVGMQNSGLGVALALQYFSALAAVPGAIFSIWHNLTGSLLAGVWRNRK